jgi:hypothetical protein
LVCWSLGDLGGLDLLVLMMAWFIGGLMSLVDERAW